MRARPPFRAIAIAAVACVLATTATMSAATAQVGEPVATPPPNQVPGVRMTVIRNDADAGERQRERRVSRSFRSSRDRRARRGREAAELRLGHAIGLARGRPGGARGGGARRRRRRHQRRRRPGHRRLRGGLPGQRLHRHRPTPALRHGRRSVGPLRHVQRRWIGHPVQLLERRLPGRPGRLPGRHHRSRGQP